MISTYKDQFRDKKYLIDLACNNFVFLSAPYNLETWCHAGTGAYDILDLYIAGGTTEWRIF